MKQLIFFVFYLLSLNTVSAATLKSLAQTSNMILVLSDYVGQKQTKKSCGFNFSKVSELSQKLKMEIEAKISSLNEKDFQILYSRLSTCEADCTCDIYALAFENKDPQKSEMFATKARQFTFESRERCAIKNTKMCHSSFLK